MKLLCISASNIISKKSSESTSYTICDLVIKEAKKITDFSYNNTIELKNHSLQPCNGCGKCYMSHRCVTKDDFNKIYEQIIDSDLVFIVSPHYAPIPAKLSMILEKMEQITFLHWVKDNNYKSEVFGIPTGIISHGGGSSWALKSYKQMVNDTIANALETIQMKTIPYNDEWNTGISLPVKKAINVNYSIFPVQEYDWIKIQETINQYLFRYFNKAYL